MKPYPPALLRIAEGPAKRWIWAFSVTVFLAVLLLNRVRIPAPEGIDPHIFARINATLNTCVSLLLLMGLFTAKARQWTAHRAAMIGAISFSVLFLVSYILHHLFTGDTTYGGEGPIRWVYYLILITHIILAAGSLPFILLTAYKALSAKYPEHRKIARRVWPVWFYVSVSGVVVYFMISPYY